MLTKVKFFIKMGGLFVLIGFVAYIAIGFTIGNRVKAMCEMSRMKYERKCVDALIMLADDSKNSFRDRNSAIWALGQLGDKRAAMLLEKYQTIDVIPNRESPDEEISRYEVKKAMSLVNGEINISAWIWRWMIEV